ncbi:hypothetical protein ACFY3G_15115 [Streptomyces phaeochromogenes]|uniref:hypothetical protein n=1 Tax=Streptomyces phaeochromogenes TaxID=1923 RepID=UPI0036A00B13
MPSDSGRIASNFAQNLNMRPNAPKSGRASSTEAYGDDAVTTRHATEIDFTDALNTRSQ